MAILLTGGTGFIGTHTAVQFIEAGFETVLVDNLSNSKKTVLDRIETISGVKPAFYKIDILDKPGLREVFSNHAIEAVVHFAGLKAVGESVEKPLLYYRNNVAGTISLCEVMRECRVKTIVFSSSATVYGDPSKVPVTEDFPVGQVTNPYGRSKRIVEEVLQDLYTSDPSWDIALLRYFNPVGAHASGLIGEDPNGIPNNLMPFITQVAVGKRPELKVFGDDYPTHDGTGIRDYIHVVDLAEGHVKAIQYLQKSAGQHIWNLGTGRGYSVFDVIKAFEAVAGKQIPHKVVARRPGDIAETWADPSKANRELDWKANREINQMCIDSWNWQQKNPDGYP